MIKTQALKEDAELLKHLVKSGSVKIDVLKMAARVGRESEVENMEYLYYTEIEEEWLRKV